ncbi:hypothetical protein KEM60_02664 [Austwickia sp. TVS 96-490-7B]|uniref:helix-turn-helix domain-containing protein n=1 Tax=Austwickia sp. TVS 96-490-7B TaxID=2830843 RepID=UPI001C57B961|nr:helix-turn-helix transcriptional regulator [Austwickia sp. TVS 96-490-7B]MBW3086444.1 hypothetical protein [Austwickia sp. TVS 96-490-7B]
MPAEESRIICNIDALLSERGMTLAELSDQVGISVVNLSVLKNNRAKAIRFSTLTAICDALNVNPGDVLSVDPSP